MIKKSLPEQLLLDFLSSYSHLLRADVVKFMVEDIDHNECGLAYDALIFEMQHKYLVADKIILADIKNIAESMAIVYPKLSTD